jgi:hypothetical protein
MGNMMMMMRAVAHMHAAQYDLIHFADGLSATACLKRTALHGFAAYHIGNDGCCMDAGSAAQRRLDA